MPARRRARRKARGGPPRIHGDLVHAGEPQEAAVELGGGSEGGQHAPHVAGDLVAIEVGQSRAGDGAPQAWADVGGGHQGDAGMVEAGQLGQLAAQFQGRHHPGRLIAVDDHVVMALALAPAGLEVGLGLGSGPGAVGSGRGLVAAEAEDQAQAEQPAERQRQRHTPSGRPTPLHAARRYLSRPQGLVALLERSSEPHPQALGKIPDLRASL